jgi:hypothetical protein
MQRLQEGSQGKESKVTKFQKFGMQRVLWNASLYGTGSTELLLTKLQ